MSVSSSACLPSELSSFLFKVPGECGKGWRTRLDPELLLNPFVFSVGFIHPFTDLCICYFLFLLYPLLSSLGKHQQSNIF